MADSTLTLDLTAKVNVINSQIFDNTDMFGVKLLNDGKCKLLSAIYNPKVQLGYCILSFTVVENMVNGLGGMHGGAIATVFDECTSMCATATVLGKQRLAEQQGDDQSEGLNRWIGGGVSRTLNVTYLRPAKVGQELVLECEMVAMGRNLATMRGSMKRKADGAVIAICEHGQANIALQDAKQKL
jgi:acyl-coenzyme A thioesterase 13